MQDLLHIISTTSRVVECSRQEQRATVSKPLQHINSVLVVQ
jgi:hypothetical protein